MAPAIPLPEPRLADSDAGLVLRPWEATPGDAAALAGAWSDPEVSVETRAPSDHSTAAAGDWIAGEAERRDRGLALDLVIADASGDEGPSERALGEVGLVNFDDAGRVEVGFWLAPEARGRGAASVAVGLLTRWALSDEGLGRRQVWARVRPGNDRAEAVLSRAGYRRLGETCGHAIWSRA